MRRFEELQEEVDKVIDKSKKKRKDNKAFAALAPALITDSEWCLIANSVEVLKPFKDALKLATEESVLSFHRAYYIFERLLDWMDTELERYANDPDMGLNLLKNEQEKDAFDAAQTKLQTYYDNKALDEAMLVPLLLDPRYGMDHIEKIWRTHPNWIDGARLVVSYITVRLNF